MSWHIDTCYFVKRGLARGAGDHQGSPLQVYYRNILGCLRLLHTVSCLLSLSYRSPI